MRLIISPAGTAQSFILEGTIDEVEAIVYKLLNNVSFTTAQADIEETPAVNIPTSSGNNFHLKNQFLNSIFVYPETNQNNSGRGRYIASLLFDGRSHTVSELIEASNATSSYTVMNAIQRMRNAGAEISISPDSDQSIRLISIQNRRYVKLHPAPKIPSTVTSKSKSSSSKKTSSVASALANFRLS